MEIKVRKGTAADIPRALELVKELALYEKAPLEVENSVEEMLKDGFGASPVFGLFVAEVNGKTEGIAIWYYKYSTWKGKCIFLEDIVVTESMRGKGIGAKLFEAVVALAREEKVRRMEWQVLDWNEPAIRFYKKYNAVLDPEWVNGKLTFDQLQQTSYSLI
ncbi:MAG: GNAT family N-acetyltransferase [Flavobacteriales bacterium]|nr:GNAT family N-acetyltransferase [Flavobacteriales bacterium]